jgi:hypothetical protein
MAEQRGVQAMRLLSRAAIQLVSLCSFLAFLGLYVRTAAPSVLSGDSAEFQMAAPLLGVPHPTTYALYMLLGKLATLIIPFGDLAYRVTLVSAGAAASAVAIFLLLARRVTGSLPAALLGALALGLAPGLWNAATIAEVYALLALLLALLGYLLAARSGGRAAGDRDGGIRSPRWRLRLAAFVAGLGCTHHGLFILAGLPLFAASILSIVVWRGAATGDRQTAQQTIRRMSPHPDLGLGQLAILALCFAAGLAPWLYPLALYARYGPFDGSDYGLPRHYFWGAPSSWNQAMGLLIGGPITHGIFRIPSIEGARAVIGLVARRLWFEFGIVGCALGLLGFVAQVRRARAVWLGAAWVFGVTLLYLLMLGPAVEDAPVFTLPMLLPWALWVAAGAELLLALARRPIMAGPRAETLAGGDPSARIRLLTRAHAHTVLFVLLVAVTLTWGYTRVPYTSKRRIWLFREFGEATLQQLPPRAVVITHWEQGMTLQYLRLAEGRRPDVWVDVVEPGDQAWPDRLRRYAGQQVFFVGDAADVAGLPVDHIRDQAYADLFQLRR